MLTPVSIVHPPRSHQPLRVAQLCAVQTLRGPRWTARCRGNQDHNQVSSPTVSSWPLNESASPLSFDCFFSKPNNRRESQSRGSCLYGVQGNIGGSGGKAAQHWWCFLSVTIETGFQGDGKAPDSPASPAWSSNTWRRRWLPQLQWPLSTETGASRKSPVRVLDVQRNLKCH